MGDSKTPQNIDSKSPSSNPSIDFDEGIDTTTTFTNAPSLPYRQYSTISNYSNRTSRSNSRSITKVSDHKNKVNKHHPQLSQDDSFLRTKSMKTLNKKEKNMKRARSRS